MAFQILEWTEQRQRTFLDRYALRDRDGVRLETQPSQMHERVVGWLARSPGERELFRWALEDFRFVPAGRILSGSGAAQKVTYYNCFVIGVGEGAAFGRDSRAGIMTTATRMIEITSRGGGVGVNWSVLRPSGSHIRGVNGISSGAVAWASGVDGMVDKVRQGGSRTAALMYMLNDWHPDIEEFISASFLRANHSVVVSNEFMAAVAHDMNWYLYFPDTSHPAYDTEWAGDLRAWEEKGYPVQLYKTIKARDLWRQMAESVVRTGNPGLAFMDRAQEMSNTAYFESYTCTNPCGEQFLPNNGCCNLGAINLVAFWNPKKQDLDWNDLSKAVRAAVRMLDRVIDLSPPLDDRIDQLQFDVRRIGLGTMGLADALILAGIRYGGPESVAWIQKTYGFIRNEAYRASAKLAQEYGPAPAYDHRFLQGKFIQRLPKEIQELIRINGIRNLTLTNQAPTGTTSILAGVSSGIEPVFSAIMTRVDATGTSVMIHPLFQGESQPHLVVSGQVTVEGHITVQGAIQHYMDNSISKTIVAPAGFTPEEVMTAYERAYVGGCKGITIYVVGSREGVMIEGDDCPTGACEI